MLANSTVPHQWTLTHKQPSPESSGPRPASPALGVKIMRNLNKLENFGAVEREREKLERRLTEVRLHAKTVALLLTMRSPPPPPPPPPSSPSSIFIACSMQS